jgi:hypothetical protein
MALPHDMFLPRPLSPITSISLICWVVGDDTDNVFPVEIKTSKTVGALKMLIKEVLHPAFDSIAANRIELYKVNVPENQFDTTLKVAKSARDVAGAIKLNSLYKLVKYFAEEPADEHVHIVVEKPRGELFLFISKHFTELLTFPPNSY